MREKGMEQAKKLDFDGKELDGNLPCILNSP